MGPVQAPHLQRLPRKANQPNPNCPIRRVTQDSLPRAQRDSFCKLTRIRLTNRTAGFIWDPSCSQEISVKNIWCQSCRRKAQRVYHFVSCCVCRHKIQVLRLFPELMRRCLFTDSETNWIQTRMSSPHVGGVSRRSLHLKLHVQAISSHSPAFCHLPHRVTWKTETDAMHNKLADFVVARTFPLQFHVRLKILQWADLEKRRFLMLAWVAFRLQYSSHSARACVHKDGPEVSCLLPCMARPGLVICSVDLQSHSVRPCFRFAYLPISKRVTQNAARSTRRTIQTGHRRASCLKWFRVFFASVLGKTDMQPVVLFCPWYDHTELYQTVHLHIPVCFWQKYFTSKKTPATYFSSSSS